MRRIAPLVLLCGLPAAPDSASSWTTLSACRGRTRTSPWPIARTSAVRSVTSRRLARSSPSPEMCGQTRPRPSQPSPTSSNSPEPENAAASHPPRSRRNSPGFPPASRRPRHPRQFHAARLQPARRARSPPQATVAAAAPRLLGPSTAGRRHADPRRPRRRYWRDQRLPASSTRRADPARSSCPMATAQHRHQPDGSVQTIPTRADGNPVLKILYFASLRERMGRPEEDVSAPPGEGTVGDLHRPSQRRDPAGAAAFAQPSPRPRRREPGVRNQRRPDPRRRRNRLLPP